jgi:integrase
VPVTSTVKPGTTRRTSNAPRGTSPAPLGTKQNQSRPRRERGDHGISWDKINKCYVGTISLGHDSAGKRVRPTVRGKTKADVKAKLDALGDEIKAGIRTPATYTVRQCVADWLDSLTLDADTIASYRGQAEKWIYPRIGARKLKDLTATDLDDFFRNIGSALGKRSMVMIKSTLRRSIRRAQKHDLIGRNVAELADLPQGQPGRPSRAMTETEAAKVLTAATGKPAGYTTVIKIGTSAQAATHAATDTGELACGNRPRPDRTLIQISTDLADTTCRACRTQLGIDQSHDEQGRLAALFVLAITLGLRPGELRALRWDHVDLDKGVIYVWRSARRDGDTKVPPIPDPAQTSTQRPENAPQPPGSRTPGSGGDLARSRPGVLPRRRPALHPRCLELALREGDETGRPGPLARPRGPSHSRIDHEQQRCPHPGHH